jgi:uncharacterized DUF497 family protein
MSGFEWDEAKRHGNIEKHGIDFYDVIPCFTSPERYILEDMRYDYGERRFHLLCPVHGRLYHIVFTKRATTYRIVSAWKANRKDQRTYERRTARTGSADH